MPNAIVVDARNETHSTFFFLRLNVCTASWAGRVGGEPLLDGERGIHVYICPTRGGCHLPGTQTQMMYSASVPARFNPGE
ncbi:unnamed protein product, partial [Brassica rapa subsp. narinosa]